MNVEHTKALGLTEAFHEAWKINRKKFMEVLGIRTFDLPKTQDMTMSNSLLKMTHEAEYHANRPTSLSVTRDLGIKDIQTGQIIQIPPPQSPPMISPLVTIPIGPMDDHLGPKRRVIRKMLFYMKHSDDLHEKVKNGDWMWRNGSITSTITGLNAEKFSAF